MQKRNLKSLKANKKMIKKKSSSVAWGEKSTNNILDNNPKTTRAQFRRRFWKLWIFHGTKSNMMGNLLIALTSHPFCTIVVCNRVTGCNFLLATFLFIKNMPANHKNFYPYPETSPSPLFTLKIIFKSNNFQKSLHTILTHFYPPQTYT